MLNVTMDALCCSIVGLDRRCSLVFVLSYSMAHRLCFFDPVFAFDFMMKASSQKMKEKVNNDVDHLSLRLSPLNC